MLPCRTCAGGARAATGDAAGAADVRRRAVRLAPQPRAGARCIVRPTVSACERHCRAWNSAYAAWPSDSDKSSCCLAHSSLCYLRLIKLLCQSSRHDHMQSSCILLTSNILLVSRTRTQVFKLGSSFVGSGVCSEFHYASVLQAACQPRMYFQAARSWGRASLQRCWAGYRGTRRRWAPAATLPRPPSRPCGMSATAQQQQQQQQQQDCKQAAWPAPRQLHPECAGICSHRMRSTLVS